MVEWFSLVLKSFGTVILVYSLLIPLFKHHNMLNLIDGLFVFVIEVIVLSFMETQNYLAFMIIIGSLLLAYVVIRIFVLRDKGEWYILFHITLKDRQAVESKFNEMIESSLIEPEMVVYDQKYPFLCKINIKDKTLKKTFFKNLDQMLKTSFSYPFAFRYGLFLLTFILLVMIWRY